MMRMHGPPLAPRALNTRASLARHSPYLCRSRWRHRMCTCCTARLAWWQATCLYKPRLVPRHLAKAPCGSCRQAAGAWSMFICRSRRAPPPQQPPLDCILQNMADTLVLVPHPTFLLNVNDTCATLQTHVTCAVPAKACAVAASRAAAGTPGRWPGGRVFHRCVVTCAVLHDNHAPAVPNRRHAGHDHLRHRATGLQV